MNDFGKFRVWCINFQMWEKHQCAVDTAGILYHLFKRGWIPLRDDTHIVEWYIGRRDRDDVPIHEGDIVECEFQMATFCGEAPKEYDRLVNLDGDKYYYRNLTGLVKRGYDGFVVEKVGPDDSDEHFYDPMGMNFSWEWCWVIGNIHDNPELLKS